MSDVPQRIITIQDISCVGRCSITVALPILSAAGFETSILPTAVLSTHTGGFTGFTYANLTGEFDAIAQHWQSLDLQTRAIYTGYLGSASLIDKVIKFANDFRVEQTIFAVDPAFADNGVLYPAFDQAYVEQMRKLSTQADLLLPNLTEAAFLLDAEYRDDLSEAEIRDIARNLSGLGSQQIILTGVSFAPDQLGALSYDAKTGDFEYYAQGRIPGYYHGTGDIFSSAALAGLLASGSLKKAIEVGVKFTHAAITRTYAAGTDVKYGVAFEPELSTLANLLK